MRKILLILGALIVGSGTASEVRAQGSAPVAVGIYMMTPIIVWSNWYGPDWYWCDYYDVWCDYPGWYYRPYWHPHYYWYHTHYDVVVRYNYVVQPRYQFKNRTYTRTTIENRYRSEPRQGMREQMQYRSAPRPMVREETRTRVTERTRVQARPQQRIHRDAQRPRLERRTPPPSMNRQAPKVQRSTPPSVNRRQSPNRK